MGAHFDGANARRGHGWARRGEASAANAVHAGKAGQTAAKRGKTRLVVAGLRREKRAQVPRADSVPAAPRSISVILSALSCVGFRFGFRREKGGAFRSPGSGSSAYSSESCPTAFGMNARPALIAPELSDRARVAPLRCSILDR